MLVISVTQLDLAISKIVYSELAGIYTINALISEKTFSCTSDNELTTALISSNENEHTEYRNDGDPC